MKVLVIFMNGSSYFLKIEHGKGVLFSLKCVQKKRVSKNIIRYIIYNNPRRYEVNLPIRLDYYLTIHSKHFIDSDLFIMVKQKIRSLLSNVIFFYVVEI